jgi:hypothetical protein
MATVELSANELQAIIDGLLFRIGGLSDLADPSHVKEGRISADDAARRRNSRESWPIDSWSFATRRIGQRKTATFLRC